MIYDHERDGESRRGRQVADWGGDDLFSTMPRRRSKYTGARPRRISGPATGSHAVRRGEATGTGRSGDDGRLEGRADVPGGRFHRLDDAPRLAPAASAAGQRFHRHDDEPALVPAPGDFGPRVDGEADRAPASGRFRRARAESGPASSTDDPHTGPSLHPVDAPLQGAHPLDGADGSSRAARAEAAERAEGDRDASGRRTVRVTGHPEALPFATARRRPRPTIEERLVSGRPDKIAGWAFGLGITLILIALGTADGGVI